MRKKADILKAGDKVIILQNPHHAGVVDIVSGNVKIHPCGI